MPELLRQAKAFAEFNSAIPAEIASSLRVCIIGPRADLRRYDKLEEKPLIKLGGYSPATATTYPWPHRRAGSRVDLSFVRVFMENAVLQFYHDAVGSGDGVISAVAGHRDRIVTSAARGFRSVSSDHPRLAALKDRDVRVGDWLRLRGGTPSQTLVTRVAGLVPDVVPAQHEAPTAAAFNAVSQPGNDLTPHGAPTVDPTGGGATGGSLAAGDYRLQYTFVGPFGETWGSPESAQFSVSAGNVPRVTLPARPEGVASIRLYLTPPGGASGSETLYAAEITSTSHDLTSAHAPGQPAVPLSAVQTAGVINNVKATASGVNYRRDATGDVTDVYTITVTQASTGGNATTARLRVTTASGRDNQASVTPAAFGSPTDIGTGGLTVTFITSGGSELQVGQSWQVVARQAFVAPSASAGGAYVGGERNREFIYSVLVSRGGRYSDAEKPQITVTRNDGGDASGPTSVTAPASAVAVGTRGLTIAFAANGSNPGLRKNDVYYIKVVSARDGACRTIVLAHNMNEQMASAPDLELTLGLTADLEVPRRRAGASPATNWDADADTITLNDGITVTEASLTDNGEPFPVPVIAGEAYAQYRAWVSHDADQLLSYTPSDGAPDTIRREVEAILGTVHPDNPLAYALWKAGINANRQKLFYIVVDDPSDPVRWADAVSILEGHKEVAHVVPLTREQAVVAAMIDHVDRRSADEVGGENRQLWLSLKAATSRVVVDATTTVDHQPVLAVLLDDPGSSGNQYTYLTCTSGNADFVSRGVMSGDVVRYLYTQDAQGASIYTEFVVGSVVNEDTLLLESGHAFPITSPQRVEIHRRLTRKELTSTLISTLKATANRRVCYVWPDLVEDSGMSVEGFFLAAALAGLAAGVAPHQGLRHVEVRGFDGASRSLTHLNNVHLHQLSRGGAFVVTQRVEDGTLYVYSAHTTDVSSAGTMEEMAVRNEHAIKALIYRYVEVFLGQANNVPMTRRQLVQNSVMSALQLAKSVTRIDRIGVMVEDFSILEIDSHPVDVGRVIIRVAVTRPYPISGVTLTVVA